MQCECDQLPSGTFAKVCDAHHELAMLEAESARINERTNCARMARDYARKLSKGTYPKAGSVEEIGERIAAYIEVPF